jgi:hypothetical protein
MGNFLMQREQPKRKLNVEWGNKRKDGDDLLEGDFSSHFGANPISEIGVHGC